MEFLVAVLIVVAISVALMLVLNWIDEFTKWFKRMFMS